MKYFSFLIYIFVFSFSIYAGDPYLTDNSENKNANNLSNDIASSHIHGNVPEKDNFKLFMQRDLEKYFSDLYLKNIRVKWEFLRKGATQTGVAMPKYYLWVVIYSGKRKISEGAVRVAAVEKNGFTVTDFVSISEIKNKSRDIYSIFPAPVCEKIKSKILK